ncbi:aminotransferase class V-fold PLP-dependent enzyme [Rhizobium sp. C4]|uniref:aminotransferase class V-fold PLP-dependent enzyme n=1 Tax=Rhizobium sp. C4 TaxID=1349800 RepID=UPI001E40CE63|nr:aminotransferase class V-fold PLP-dependent enzyme [Rhizobium sp. C4]MCD2175019.1 aminotransferase class V-fold PLP-dependent enzyme [Rhizobium sp. C4]
MSASIEEFDNLRSIRYFDVAALGITPQSVRTSTGAMLEQKMSWGMASHSDLSSDRVIAHAEQAVRSLLGVTGGKSFIASSSMSAAYSILQALPHNGGTIVCAANEYPGLVEVARTLSRQTGLELRFVESAEDGSTNLLEAISDRTEVVVVSQVHWVTGRVNPIEELGKARRHLNFVLVVDASQGLPIAPLNPEKIEADVVVAAGFKWLAGALGSAVAHISERLLDVLASRLGPSLWPIVPSTQSYVAMHNLAASISWMQEFGIEKIRNDTIQAAQAIRDFGQDVGWSPLGGNGRQSSGIVSFPFPAAQAEYIVGQARAAGLYLSARAGAIRLSPHFTVSINECRNAVGLLKQISLMPK